MKESIDTNKLIITTTIGKDLSQETIEYMVKHRMREYGENKKDFENNERNSIFFFLEDDDIIKAFGMLKPVTLYYDDKKYQIMGIWNIMAVEKSKWYGTVLMKHIMNYLKNNEHVGMGSTHGNNFTFYEKCGFRFIPGLLERVIYIDAINKEFRRESECWDHSMFMFDKNNELQGLVKGDKDVIVKVPFW